MCLRTEVADTLFALLEEDQRLGRLLVEEEEEADRAYAEDRLRRGLVALVIDGNRETLPGRLLSDRGANAAPPTGYDQCLACAHCLSRLRFKPRTTR